MKGSKLIDEHEVPAGKSKNKNERFSLTLPPKQSRKLNDYCLAVANKLGRMPHAIKTKIMRMALDEWLENHGSDHDINFDFDVQL